MTVILEKNFVQILTARTVSQKGRAKCKYESRFFGAAKILYSLVVHSRNWDLPTRRNPDISPLIKYPVLSVQGQWIRMSGFEQNIEQPRGRMNAKPHRRIYENSYFE